MVSVFRIIEFYLKCFCYTYDLIRRLVFFFVIREVWGGNEFLVLVES